MYPTKITLTVAEGFLPEKEYAFQGPTQCVIGRAEDCDIQIPSDLAHADVSRRHCLLEINPPTLIVRDLGSRNGTFVNGEKIGQRSEAVVPDDTEHNEPREHALKDGDELQLGRTVLRVGISHVPDLPPVPLQFV